MTEKSHRTPTVLALLLVVAGVAGGQQEVGIRAATDSSEYTMGDWVVVQVEARTSPEVRTVAPAFGDSVGAFEVLKVERSENRPAWVVRLMTIDTGKTFIPPLPFAYTVEGDTTQRIAYANSIALNIRGVTVNPEGEIRDIKPPAEAPWLFEDYLPYLIGLIMLTAVGAGIYFWNMYRKKKAALDIPYIPAVPPHTEALTALRILEDKKLWQQGKIKEFYSEITQIIRRFFERRWNVVALELTSDEILVNMKLVPESQAVGKQMQSFFTTADLVKFAKYSPAPGEHEQELAWAYEIVRSMVPPAPTPETEVQTEQETADVR